MTQTQPTTTSSDKGRSKPLLDKDALKRKYAEERAKRLRPDGIDQYSRLSGRFAHYAEDPYTPVADREPKTDHVTFAFVGGGFAGLVTGARLKEAGIEDVRIVEKGGDFGGTWYWNRYPGAQCDTASMVYMPLLEETGHMPTEKYAHAPEILEHSQRIGKQFGLYDHALFHTEVTGLQWLDDRSAWLVTTNRGDRFTAQFIGMGTGPLHVAKLPGIPGIESFGGHSFHTSRWDYDYTGGDPSGAPLSQLADKRVAIIGTGRHGRPVRPPPRPGRPGALRLPADPLVGGRPGQPAHRSRMVRLDRDPGLAATLARELHRQSGRRRRRRGPRHGRLDRALPPHPLEDHGPPRRREDGRRDARRVRGLGFREDGGDPVADRRRSSATERPRPA